jgi:hypothetical protein
MTPHIQSFEREAYGLFVDLDNGGSVALNLKTGDVLLDERDEMAVFRSVVLAQECRRFSLHPTSVRGETVELRLLYGSNEMVKIGHTSDHSTALKWINLANNYLDKLKRNASTKTAAIAVFNPSARKNRSKPRISTTKKMSLVH